MMALVSRVQMKMGHETIAAHPDFNNQYCRNLLNNPDIKWMQDNHVGTTREEVSNSMFEDTLYHEQGIRAHLSFSRPCKEPDSIRRWEDCFLLSIGTGLDGKTGRAHGGLSSLLLDHVSGHCAHYAHPVSISPATATLSIDFKNPISTPCLLLARAWLIEFTGRKVWVKGLLEGEEGQVYATAKSLFILAKEAKL